MTKYDRYNRSAKGRARTGRYNASEKRRATRARYDAAHPFIASDRYIAKCSRLADELVANVINERKKKNGTGVLL